MKSACFCFATSLLLLGLGTVTVACRPQEIVFGIVALFGSGFMTAAGLSAFFGRGEEPLM